MTELKCAKVDEKTIRLKALETATKVYSDKNLDNIVHNCPVGKEDPATALLTRWFQT